MPSFSIRNFGCRVNQAEAFAWAEAFRTGGLRREDDPARSDLVVVNSCTLTARADRDVRRFIEKISRENPAAGIVVTGCGAVEALERAGTPPRVVLVVPNAEKEGLPGKVLALAARGEPRRKAAEGTAAAAAEYGPAGDFFRARALLKIQDGCDNRCAFCVIPSVRGRSASVGEDTVLARVRDLVAAGYREIVLAGIHLSSYGADLGPGHSLAGLVERVERIEGLGRIRLSSLDPRRTDAALAARLAGNPRICQHFHLSLQHASERVLKDMGRPAGTDAAGSLLADLRRRSPDAALGADVIAGFPGETEDDFARLEEFLREFPLTYWHAFPYSPRPGTLAAARPQVPDAVKSRRAVALRRLSAAKNLRFRQSFEGRELEAVVIRAAGKADLTMSSRGLKGRGDLYYEAESRTEEEGMEPGIPMDSRSCGKGFAEVLTGNYIRALVPDCRAPRREIVRVRITRALPGSTEAVFVGR
jgi:threonylcarbamoyladenosine tRNA methylthiotransferase MtaB